MLKGQENANIINISSISAKLGGSSVAYSVAKTDVDIKAMHLHTIILDNIQIFRIIFPSCNI